MASNYAKVGSDVEVSNLEVRLGEEKINKPTVDEEKKTATLNELYQYADGYDKVFMFFGTVGAILTGFCQPTMCLLFGTALDNLNGSNVRQSIDQLALYLVYLGIGNVIVATIETGCWALTGERQAQRFREAYVKSVLSQEIGWFDTVGASQLATKLFDLTGVLRDGMTYKTADLIQFASQVFGSVLVGLALDPYVALIMFACTPLIGGSAALWVNAISKATKGTAEQYANAGGLANESLTAIRTVTALNAQPNIITNYRKFLLEAMQIGILRSLNVGLATGSMWFIVLCTYAITLWYGSTQIADTLKYGYTDWPRAQTGGKVYASFFACLMGAFGLGQIAPSLAAFTSARVAAKTLIDVILRKPLIDGLSDAGITPKERPKGLVQLQDVVFAYPSRPDNIVCRGYKLTIEPGQSCALVGASGSGKSTVINLLLRFYDPQSGSIRLDGMNINKLNTRWLRAQIGYVGQEPVLFSGTIADNISYGLDFTFAPELAKIESPDSTEEEKQQAKNILMERIIEAAKQANAHDFITSLPQGYETDVGSSGSSMSGGQKQRIAIARALIKKPAVLLLDEATSALDATSERMVQESIDKLQQSKMQTTIIIAHRLNTIRSADKIAVVSEGQIAEEGSHDELIALDRLYADLVRLQMEGQEESKLSGQSYELSSESLTALETADAASSEETKAGEGKNGEQTGIVRQPSHHHHKREKKGEKDAGEKTKNIVELSKEESRLLSKKIWAMIYEHKTWFALAVIGASMVGAMFPLWGYIVGKSLGVLFTANESDLRIDAGKQAGYFVGLAADASIGAILQMWCIGQVGERIIMKLRSDQFQAILRREIEYFDKKENSVGELTSRLADDARVVAKATGTAAAQQIQAFACLVIGLILGFSACWKIGLVTLACLVPMIIAGAVKMAAYSGQLNSFLFKKSKDADSENGVISTAFTQMRTVSAFSVQFKVARVYNAITQEKMETYKKAAWIAGVAKGVAEFVSDASFALLFVYAGILLSDGEFRFGPIMEAMLAVMFASFGLGQAMADMGDIKEGLRAADRMFKTIEEGNKASIDGLSTAGEKPGRAEGRIELRHVNFCYPTRPDMQVCKDYNLVIEQGEVVALVGPSGSGKSTIMNLLLRFYDPLDGDVLLDGRRLQNLNVRWLRSQIGYVGQEPVLFKGSVAENIARGRASYGEVALMSLEEVLAQYGATGKKSPGTKTHVAPAAGDIEMPSTVSDVDPDIIEAAKASNAHDFIMTFTDQYNTDVGESSMMVSGGQKQRIAIARALIKKPAVLLLDEATSALDAASERMVQDAIDVLQQSKMQTTIVIAHRLTTIRNADKIAVIDNGRVVEIGKHDDLLQANGLYAELWNKQAGASKTVSRVASKVNVDSAFT